MSVYLVAVFLFLLLSLMGLFLAWYLLNKVQESMLNYGSIFWILLGIFAGVVVGLLSFSGILVSVMEGIRVIWNL